MPPDLVVTTDAETFAAIAVGRRSPEEAAASGALQVEGDAATMQHCLDVLAGGGSPA